MCIYVPKKRDVLCYVLHIKYILFILIFSFYFLPNHNHIWLRVEMKMGKEMWNENPVKENRNDKMLSKWSFRNGMKKTEDQTFAIPTQLNSSHSTVNIFSAPFFPHWRELFVIMLNFMNWWPWKFPNETNKLLKLIQVISPKKKIYDRLLIFLETIKCGLLM